MNSRQKKAYAEASRRLTTVLMELSEENREFVEPSARVINALAGIYELDRQLTKENPSNEHNQSTVDLP